MIKEAFVDQILSAIEADDCGKHPLHPGTGNNPAEYDEDIWAARLAEYQEYQQELKSDLMSVDEKILRKHYTAHVIPFKKFAVAMVAMIATLPASVPLYIVAPVMLYATRVLGWQNFKHQWARSTGQFTRKFDQVLNEDFEQ